MIPKLQKKKKKKKKKKKLHSHLDMTNIHPHLVQLIASPSSIPAATLPIPLAPLLIRVLAAADAAAQPRDRVMVALGADIAAEITAQLAAVIQGLVRRR
jgi:hypothetical protein